MCSLYAYDINGREVGKADPDADKGGHFEFAGLKPGIYEVRGEVGYSYSKDVQGYAPFRQFGVQVAENRTASADFVLRPGSDVLELGKPAMSNAAFTKGKCWLDGTIRLDTGKPCSGLMASIFLVDKEGNTVVKVDPEAEMMGLFDTREVPKGRYDLVVRLGPQYDKSVEGFRPVRVPSITFNPGVRVKLKLVLSKGQGVETLALPKLWIRSIGVDVVMTDPDR